MNLKKTNFIGVLRYAIIVFVLIGMLFIPMDELHAYSVIGYRFDVQWQYGEYYSPPGAKTYNGVTIDYHPIISSAVTAWNNAINPMTGHPLDVSLRKGTSATIEKTRVSVAAHDYGPVGWYGLARFHYYSGGTLKDYPGVPTGDYRAGSALLNISLLHSKPSWFKQNVVMHEIGHIFGLLHSSVTNSLMHANVGSYTKLTLPQNDDITGVRDVYRPGITPYSSLEKEK